MKYRRNITHTRIMSLWGRNEEKTVASHLDAFSAYPIQTQIPSGAPGGTTGKQLITLILPTKTIINTVSIRKHLQINCIVLKMVAII